MENTVLEREIKYLFHFTNIDNIGSILENGLLSRQYLDNNDFNYSYNDNLRLDNQENSICLTISFPNYKMFYSLRVNNSDHKWCVIVLKPDILWEKDCAFYKNNAATAGSANIPIIQRKSIAAFNELFTPILNIPSRESLNLHKSFPTNPQAEVLVFDRIDTSYIVGIATISKSDAIELNNKFSVDLFSYHKFPFSARKDFEVWR